MPQSEQYLRQSSSEDRIIARGVASNMPHKTLANDHCHFLRTFFLYKKEL